MTQPCGFPPFLASRFDSQIASGLLEAGLLCQQWVKGAPLPHHALVSSAFLHLQTSSAPATRFAPSAKLHGVGEGCQHPWMRAGGGNRNPDGKTSQETPFPPAVLPLGLPALRGLVYAGRSHLEGSCRGDVLLPVSLWGQKELFLRDKWWSHQLNFCAFLLFISIHEILPDFYPGGRTAGCKNMA